MCSLYRETDGNSWENFEWVRKTRPFRLESATCLLCFPHLRIPFNIFIIHTVYFFDLLLFLFFCRFIFTLYRYFRCVIESLETEGSKNSKGFVDSAKIHRGKITFIFRCNLKWLVLYIKVRENSIFQFILN